MKKNFEQIFGIVLFVALLASCTPSATAVPTAIPTAASAPNATLLPSTPTATALPPNVRLKESASLYAGAGNLAYPTLASLPAGTNLSALGICTDFVQVSGTLDGKTQTGYIYKKALEQVPSDLSHIVPASIPGYCEWQKISLPLSFDEKIPDNRLPIRLDNAKGIQALGVYLSAYVETVRFSGDGKWLFAMNPEQVNVFSLDTNENLTQLDLGGSLAIATSRDGNVFALAQGQAVHVFQRDGKELFAIPNPANTANHCADLVISPDGGMVAVDCFDSFSVYSIPSGKSIYTWDQKSLTLHGSRPQFSPDGKFISASYAAGIGVWKVEDWSKAGDFPAGYIGYFTIDDPDLLVIRAGTPWGSPTSSFQVWKISERKMVKQVEVKSDQWNFVLTTYTSTSTGELVLPHLVDDGSLIYTVLPPGRKADAWFELNRPDFRFVTRSTGPALFARQLFNGDASFLTLDGKLEPLKGNAVVLGADNQLYIGMVHTEKNPIVTEFRPVGQSQVVTTLAGNGQSYYAWVSSLDPIHQYAFYSVPLDANNSTAYIENYRTSGKVKSWTKSWINPVSYSKDGKYAAFYVNHNPKMSLVIFDLVNSTIVYEELFSWGTNTPSFSPDSSKVVYALSPAKDVIPNFVEIIDVLPPHQKTRISFNLPKDIYPMAAAFSPGGSLLAVGFSDGTLRIINLADGSVVHEWQGHHEMVSAVTFSDDGTLLATSGWSGIIKLWGVLNQ